MWDKFTKPIKNGLNQAVNAVNPFGQKVENNLMPGNNENAQKEDNIQIVDVNNNKEEEKEKVDEDGDVFYDFEEVKADDINDVKKDDVVPEPQEDTNPFKQKRELPEGINDENGDFLQEENLNPQPQPPPQGFFDTQKEREITDLVKDLNLNNDSEKEYAYQFLSCRQKGDEAEQDIDLHLRILAKMFPEKQYDRAVIYEAHEDACNAASTEQEPKRDEAYLKAFFQKLKLFQKDVHKVNSKDSNADAITNETATGVDFFGCKGAIRDALSATFKHKNGNECFKVERDTNSKIDSLNIYKIDDGGKKSDTSILMEADKLSLEVPKEKELSPEIQELLKIMAFVTITAIEAAIKYEKDTKGSGINEKDFKKIYIEGGPDKAAKFLEDKYYEVLQERGYDLNDWNIQPPQKQTTNSLTQ